jgi:hypothetical protein
MSRYYIYDSVTDQVAEFAKGGVFRNLQAMGKKTARKVSRSGFGRQATKLGKAVGEQASLRGQQALGLATSAPGLAALGTAGVAGGAYALNKRSKKKAEEAKQKRSIKGRIKSLLGR